MRFVPFILYAGAVCADVASLPPALLSSIKELASAAPTGYAPQKTACPTTPVVRVATGLSTNEQDYIAQRKPIADAALSSWLQKTSSQFDTNCTLPVLGFSSSGGGERATLVTAGVHEAFDERSSNASVAGLWQALTYEAALSGGGIFLVGWAMHNYEPLPSLIRSFWQSSLNNGLLYPFGKGTQKYNVTRNIIHGQAFQKALAGYPITYVDLFGRFESYSFLSADGAPASHFGDITIQPFFQTFQSPFPMIVAGGVNAFGDSCPLSNLSDPAYEFNPYEFGSWQKGISAFANITYLGSQPCTDEAACVTGYDNTGFAIGTSGNVLGLNCTEFNAKLPAVFAEYNVSHQLAELLFPSNKSLFARYPNPFYNSSSSPKVSAYPDINMVDGGLVSDVAITPLLYRDVDVLFVSDNSGETADGYVNGTNLHGTYLRAQLNNLTRMPPVPDPPTFLNHGFGNRNVFFGCNATDAMTLVYMPNRDVVYPSNYGRTPDPMSDEVLYGLLDNGRAIGSDNGTADWAECVGCAIMGKMATTLPRFCGACFSKYCAVW